MTTITDSPYQRALESLKSLSMADDGKRLDISKIRQDPELKRKFAEQFAALRARNAELKRMGDEIRSVRSIEDHSIQLHNITSLELATAQKVRDWVSVDVATGADKGMTVHGYCGDKEVSSLKDYLSLVTAYIDKTLKAAPRSVQPDTSQATSPASPPSKDAATPDASRPTAPSVDASAPAAALPGADPNWTDPVGLPGQNHIRFPNVASLTREMAAAVYKQVSTMVQTRDISGSVIHAKNGAAGTYSVETYMSWLAQRAATDIVA